LADRATKSDGEYPWVMSRLGEILPCSLTLDGRRYVVVPGYSGNELDATAVIEDATAGGRIVVCPGQDEETSGLPAIGWN